MNGEGNLKHLYLLLVLFVLMAGTGVRAQEAGDAAPSAPQPTDESSLILGGDSPAAETVPAAPQPLSAFGVWDFLRMVLVLALVVGLIYGVFHFIRKAGGSRDDGVRFIRVLETRPLAAGRQLHLVELGNEVLLVGSAENGVSLISGVTDQETLDGIRLAAAQARPRAGGFAGALKEFFGKGRGGPPAPGGGESSADDSGGGRQASLDFLQGQKGRLKKLFRP